MKKKPYVYVALGDSTVEGYGASHPRKTYPNIIFETIKHIYKNASFHNLGKNNARIIDVIEHQLDKAILYQPSLITISIGGNDIRYATRLRHFEHYLDLVFKRLTTETSADIIINTIPDFSGLPAVPKKYRALSKILLQRFNSVIKKKAKTWGVTVIDVSHQSKVFQDIYPEIIYKDGFHPSDMGYALWANTIITAITDSHLTKKRWFQ